MRSPPSITDWLSTVPPMPKPLSRSHCVSAALMLPPAPAARGERGEEDRVAHVATGGRGGPHEAGPEDAPYARGNEDVGEGGEKKERPRHDEPLRPLDYLARPRAEHDHRRRPEEDG